MANKEMTLIVKILGLVGAIFCGICLILPWAGLSGLGGVFDLYPWGVSALGVWDMFFIDYMSSGVSVSPYNHSINPLIA